MISLSAKKRVKKHKFCLLNLLHSFRNELSTPIFNSGKKWIVDGYLDYGGSRDWGSTFKGTLTHEKEGVLVVFGSGGSHFKERSFGIGVGFDEDEQERIKEVLIGHVFSRYKWNYIEAFSLEKA